MTIFRSPCSCIAFVGHVQTVKDDSVDDINYFFRLHNQNKVLDGLVAEAKITLRYVSIAL